MKIECVSGFRAHKDRGLCQILLDCNECSVAFFIPFGPVGSSQSSEEGF